MLVYLCIICTVTFALIALTACPDRALQLLLLLTPTLQHVDCTHDCAVASVLSVLQYLRR
jgi:hypothetical protein